MKDAFTITIITQKQHINEACVLEVLRNNSNNFRVVDIIPISTHQQKRHTVDNTSFGVFFWLLTFFLADMNTRTLIETWGCDWFCNFVSKFCIFTIILKTVLYDRHHFHVWDGNSGRIFFLAVQFSCVKWCQCTKKCNIQKVPQNVNILSTQSTR